MSQFFIKPFFPTNLRCRSSVRLPECLPRGRPWDLNFRAITLSKGLILFFLCYPFATALCTQSPDDKPANELVSLARPCSFAASGSKSKEKAKSKPAMRRVPSAPACIEAKGSLVELHEFFQSYVRAQNWRIDDERVAQDSWIFSRYLDKEELLQFAKEGAYTGRVRWTEGKAVVQITAHELEGGFTRVEVSAQFQGGGQNVDRFAPPRDTWNLDSTGALEKSLIGALEAHLKSLH